MPDTFAAAANALRGHFQAQWVALGRLEPIAWDGRDFVATLGQAYVAFMVQPARTAPVSTGPVGGRRVRTRGLITVDVKTPVGQSDGPNQALVDVVVSVWSLAVLPGFAINASEVVRVGPFDGWFAQRVVTSFHWDTLK